MVKNKEETRLEFWSKRKFLPEVTYGETNNLYEAYLSKATPVPVDDDDSDEGLSIFSFMQSAKEVVFDNSGNLPNFHFITIGYSIEHARIVLDAALQTSFTDEKPEEIEQDLIRTLAFAAILEVPVFPNSKSDIAELSRLHQRMKADGFEIKNQDGEIDTYTLNMRSAIQIGPDNHSKTLDISGPLPPVEIELLRNSLSNEISRLGHVNFVLSKLTNAISSLELLLEKEGRHENDLQKCLTENPILFGPEYIEIIPKHRLGAEYELDYALRTAAGNIHFVEIEASSLSLFTLKGRPRANLIQAEQQILDWFMWIEDNKSYAEKRLPQIDNPFGILVIGRSIDMTDSEKKILRHRNSLFRGRMKIMTYDDLLIQSRALLERLTTPDTYSTN